MSKTYELLDVIKIAQGFATEGQFTVLPNEVVGEIVRDLEEANNAEALSEEIPTLFAAPGCGCLACINIRSLSDLNTLVKVSE